MTGTPSKDRAEAHAGEAKELLVRYEYLLRGTGTKDEIFVSLISDALATSFAEGMKRAAEWCTDVDAAPELEVHNVVGRYRDATAGFPRYAAKVHGRWLEYSRREPEEIIVWAWRPRDDWPRQEGR